MKFCPHCGAPVKRNEKFCIRCGFPLKGQGTKSTSSQAITGADASQESRGPAKQPSQSRPNNQSNWQQADQTWNKAKKYSNGYFNWLINTIKNPTSLDPNVHPYYGITSIIVGMLLMLLSLYNIINNISSIFNNVIDKFGGDDEPDANMISSVVNKFKGSSIKDAILLCVVSFVIYWLAGFLSRKFTSDRGLNALQYSNQLATFTNSALICEVIVFILTLLSAYILSFYVILLAFVIYNVGLIYSIVRDSNSAGRLYAAIIASCCTPIAFVLVVKYIVHSFIMNSIF